MVIHMAPSKMRPDETQGERETYPLDMGYLPQKFIAKAEEELHETPEIRDIKIKELRALLKNVPSLNEEWFRDEDILMYLRSRKFDAKKAFTAMTRLATFIKDHKHYFQPFDYAKAEKIAKSMVITALPRRDEEGCTIFHITVRNWQTSEYSFDDLVKFVVLGMMHYLRDPMTQVNGAKLIYDFNASLFKYLKYFNPYNIYTLHQLMMDCIPFRLKGIYLINAHAIAKIALPLVLSLVSEKLKSRFKVHADPKELLEHMLADVVPAKFGGQLQEDNNGNAWIKCARLPYYMTAILNSS